MAPAASVAAEAARENGTNLGSPHLANQFPQVNQAIAEGGTGNATAQRVLRQLYHRAEIDAAALRDLTVNQQDPSEMAALAHLWAWISEMLLEDTRIVFSFAQLGLAPEMIQQLIGWCSWFGVPLIIRSQIRIYRSRLQTSPLNRSRTFSFRSTH